MPTTNYFLANRVFLCRTGRHCVFLDLNADRYFAVAQDQLEAIGSWLHGWPACGRQPDRPQNTDGAERPCLGDVLVRRGLLTTDPACGRDVAPTCYPLPTRGLVLGRYTVNRDSGLRHLRNFLVAGCSAGLRRHWQPIANIVGAHACRQRRDSDRFDESRCGELVGVFGELRPYFPGKPSCLPDSHMLVEFLRRYGMQADWVFGVRTEPFAAHCWVQRDDLVLNDTPEHVGSFAPIMAV
jgi:hypothetical protein